MSSEELRDALAKLFENDHKKLAEAMGITERSVRNQLAGIHSAGGPQRRLLREWIRRCARPLSEWRKEMGPVLWWQFPVNEPPYVGTPRDIGTIVHVDENGYEVLAGGWPGYHTHWTPIVEPWEAKEEKETTK